MESERKQAKHQSRKCMKRHVCRECNAAFSFPNKLRVHIQAVHSMSHECDHCGRKFNRFNQLRTHVSFVHRIRHKCEVCDYSSSVKAEVKKHFIINHQNGVRCTVDGCGITIAYNRLRRHIREKHTVESKGVVVSNDCSEPILNCNQCNFIGSNGEDISIHLEKAHGGGLLCPVLNCKKRMMLCDLKSHLDTTHCELEVELPERHLQGESCRKCGSMEDGTERNEDVQSKSEELNVECSGIASSSVASVDVISSLSVSAVTSTDGEGLDNMLSLRNNEISWAEVNGGLTNSSLKRLRGSSSVHAGDYTCEQCGKRYLKRRDVVRHIRRVHEQAYSNKKREDYKCSVDSCPKIFPSRAKLLDHLVTHTAVITAVEG